MLFRWPAIGMLGLLVCIERGFYSDVCRYACKSLQGSQFIYCAHALPKSPGGGPARCQIVSDSIVMNSSRNGLKDQQVCREAIAAAPGAPGHVLSYMHALEIMQRYSQVLAAAQELLLTTRCPCCHAATLQ